MRTKIYAFLILLLIFCSRTNAQAERLENLGEPVLNHGIPSTNLWKEGNLLYGEAKDPFGTGVFFAYNISSKKVIFQGGNPTGFRNIAIDKQGNAYYAVNNQLQKYDPRTNSVTTLSVSFPSGGWMRASTRQTSDGWIYGITQDPAKIFRFNPSTNVLEEIGTAWDYTTSVVLDPTERYMYYIPGAHGSSPLQGTPVLQFDVQTKQHKVIAFLNSFYFSTYGYTLGGTYGIDLNPEGKTLYIDMNANKGTGSFNDPVFLAIHIPASEAPQVQIPALRFEDVTNQSGLYDPLIGAYVHSAAWGDADNDGWVDLFVGMFTDSPLSYYQKRGATGPAPNRLLFNRNGRFVNSGQSAIEIFGRASGSVFADLDNDGDLDLVVSNNRISSSTNAYTLEPHHLYKNLGNGTFEDVSVSSGIRASDSNGRSVAVLDYNNDKLLDLIIVGDQLRGGGGPTKLFKNKGSLVFEDATTSAGLPSNVYGLGIAVGDVNSDGWPDFFIAGGPAGDFGRNYLFVNNKDGTFREVNPGFFKWTTNGGEDYVSGAAFGDVNRDGRLDLLVTSHFGSSEGLGIPISPKLYKNNGNDASGNPIFEDMTSSAGLTGITTKSPHGEIQDFDNDGWPDIYVSVKAVTPNGIQPFIYKHKGTITGANPSFTPPTYTSLSYFPGGPVADYNRDGKLDVFFEEFRTSNPPMLIRNTGAPGNWLQVKVEDGSTTMGIGAKVKIYKAGMLGNVAGLLGFVEINVGYGFSSGQPAVAHFGLGNETKVDVEVTMPFGRGVYTRTSVPANRLLVMPNGTTERPAHLGFEITAVTDMSSSFLTDPSFTPPTPYTKATTPPTVDFAAYPKPSYAGNPWSMWGQTLFASNRRFYSAIGDHKAPDGNSFVYEYDPITKKLKMIGDVQNATNHVPGSWGHGKIHASINEANDGYIYTTTYWGSSTGIIFDSNYKGSVILRYPLNMVSGGAPPPPTAFDFSLSTPSPSSATVTQGSSTSPISLTVTITGSGTVTLTCTGPVGVSCTFTPGICSSTCTSSVTISTEPSTPTGTHAITITGTSGTLTRTATFTLTVNAAAACSGSAALTLTPSTVAVSGSVTPAASGLTSCSGKTISFKSGSCSGTQVSSCTSTSTGCTGTAFTAPSTAGSYTYFACIDQNTDGDFADTGESDSELLTVTAAPTCTLTSATITPVCSGGSSTNCEAGESITMSGTYINDCSAADFFQIDASATGCNIQFTGGDMSGISDSTITVSGGTISSASWTIPTIPSTCQGKTVTATNAALYDGGPPGTGTWLTGTTSTGSFIFASAADTVQPTVTIDFPANNAVVNGVVTITATATDNIGVTQVEFYIDGVLKIADMASPYTYSWNTVLETNGVHTLTAKAYDAAGNSATSTVTVTVDNAAPDTTKPTVIITNPPANDIVFGMINVTVTANDNIAISSVLFFVDGLQRKNDTVAPYDFGLNASRLTNITHNLSARAYDTSGNFNTHNITIIVDESRKIADVNSDGDVDLADIIVMIVAWGTSGTTDINKDGVTNLIDIGIMLSKWTG